MNRTLTALRKFICAQSEKVSYLENLERLIEMQRAVVEFEADRKYGENYYSAMRELRRLIKLYGEEVEKSKERADLTQNSA